MKYKKLRITLWRKQIIQCKQHQKLILISTGQIKYSQGQRTGQDATRNRMQGQRPTGGQNGMRPAQQGQRPTSQGNTTNNRSEQGTEKSIFRRSKILSG